MMTTSAAPLTVRDVMSAPAVSLSPDTAYAAIVHRFLSSDIGGLPVVDESGRLLGIVTESDLLFKEAYLPGSDDDDDAAARFARWQQKASARTARDLMTLDPSTASLDEPLDVVARRLLEHAVSRLPVVRDGRVVGIVSRHDVLRRFARPDYAIAADIERALVDVPGVTARSTRTSVSDGDVVLSGSVDALEDIVTIAEVAAGVDGAVSIDNRLVVADGPVRPARHHG
jgi:CBS domain-containing protein